MKLLEADRTRALQPVDQALALEELEDEHDAVLGIVLDVEPMTLEVFDLLLRVYVRRDGLRGVVRSRERRQQENCKRNGPCGHPPCYRHTAVRIAST